MNWLTVPRRNFGYAQSLRQEMTLPERLLWNALRASSMGARFRRQHTIGPYIVDFYCREAHLVVEIDSDLAHGSQESLDRDQRKDDYLAARGLRTLRVRAGDVLTDVAGVVDAVSCALTPLNPPVKRGETSPESRYGP